MPAQQMISAAIEAAINQALRWANNSEELLAPLSGKTCIIYIHEIDRGLSLNFARDDVHIVVNEEGIYKSMPDTLNDNECWFSLSLFVLKDLRQNNQITKLIKSGQLDFAGDLSILQNLSAMFDKLELDLEEVLSQYLGDVGAYQVSQTGIKISQKAQQHLSLIMQTFSDAALDEKPIGVRKIMLVNFCDEVQCVSEQCANVEARIKSLEDKLRANKA